MPRSQTNQSQGAQYGTGPMYISPWLMTAQPSSGRGQSSPWTNSPSVPQASYAPSKPRPPPIKLEDITTLAPGRIHHLPLPPSAIPAPVPMPVPTPQSILDGSYQAALEAAQAQSQKSDVEQDIVFYAPRIARFTEKTFNHIIFTFRGGLPGPYVEDLLAKKVVVDNGDEEPFKEYGWSRTKVTIDWPGVTPLPTAVYLSCGPTTDFHTKQQVAIMVAGLVTQFRDEVKAGKRFRQVINSASRNWNVKKISLRDVRLIGLNYYKTTWVPVLALDAPRK